ncbi:hypothetical protein C8R45DRAFT_1131086 [Mycena sanguinolenta]|nr:hypothetical protein C8R45DRAFT_1131086 [Mycena sanguinolenta]
MPYTSLSSSGERSIIVIYRTSAELGADDPCREETPATHAPSQFWTRLATVILHIGLVGVHLAILVIAFKRLEHDITFSVGLQTTVSFWTTAISTTIGTVYCSCLVFLSQRLALQSGTGSRSLTSVHDRNSSWRGFGSALSVLYNQIALPSSVLQSLVVVLYLGGISILHITIPATFSVETFNASIFLEVPTVGVPEYNASNINSSSAFTSTFPQQFLPWFGNLQDSQTVGLFNGTMYEVLQGSNLGPGIANVSAAGINISCGYAPPESINVTAEDPFQFDLSLAPIWLDEGERPLSIQTLSARANMVQVLADGGLKNSVILWTTLEVQDSSGNTGNPVIVDGAKDLNNATINQLQVLQCSKSIVAQSALVDTETTKVNNSSIYPDIYKTESTWQSCQGLNLTADDSTLLGSDAWSEILASDYDISDFFTVIEENLMEYLRVDPLNSTVDSLQLHEIENGLSSLVATTFWIAGHIPPDAITMQSSATNRSGVVTPAYVPPVLVAGTTTAQQVRTLVRLNINQFAVWCGFGTSVILLMLSASSIASSMGSDGFFLGPGILQVIWWSQQNAEDIDFLENVCQPTELNLRIAGLGFIPEKSNRKLGPKHPKNLKPERGSTSACTISTVNWPKIICIILHILLVLVHAIVLWIRATNSDHRIVFQLGLQGVISLWYKVMSTVIGTSYYSILLYLVQKQAISHAMKTHNTLASMHDRVNSWAGLGSSIATLYQQLVLPASFSATLAIFGYLAAVSTLHVTTPALISVEIFNSTISSQVVIEGLPQWPDSDHESTISYLQNDAQFLGYLGALDLSQTIGLFNGTLYDTLTDVYDNSGLINASATGFEVKCGYLPGTANSSESIYSMTDQHSYGYNVSFGQFGWTQVVAPGPDLVTLSAAYLESRLQDPGLSHSIVVYTTNELLDSAGNSGSPVNLFPSAQVDPGSRTIIPDTLNPVIYKTQSNWLSFADLPDAMDSGRSLINSSSWATILSALPASGLFTVGMVYPTWGDAHVYSFVQISRDLFRHSFVMEQLGLQPAVGYGIVVTTNRTLYLHELENALSNLIASVFWIAGHIRPPPLTMRYGFSNHSGGAITVINVQEPPILEQNTTTLTQNVRAARLNVSPLAASIGLAGSVMLLVFAVSVCGTSIGTLPSYLQSMGLLQTLWVYRHHPELWEIIEHLEKPTDRDLRVTGLVNVRLLDAESNQVS